LACVVAFGGGGSSILASVACIACSIVDSGLIGFSTLLASTDVSPDPLLQITHTLF